MEPSLSQGYGYLVIILGSVLFLVLLNSFTYLQNKYSKFKANGVDEFLSGSRSVKFGLLLASIVLNWCWSLTLLQPSVLTYNASIFSCYAYGCGGLLQVSVFSIISSKIKKNANLVTTFPEMGYFRFGKPGHLAFLWCGFVCNAIVSACILLGGSGVIEAITGVSQYATLFLIPFFIACYISFGGLRSTLIADASNMVIILVFIVVFLFQVYVVDDRIGSAQRMWELLLTLPPVKGNYQGSYITFRSEQSAIYLIISIITGFGLVVADQAYLQRAVAADPKITSKAYFFGALCWFVIPVSMGTSLGLGARALSVYPDFPSLSDFEVGQGLPAVATVTYLLGRSGAAMMLVMIFFSVATSFAGELIATSTLISYDIYKRYFKPDATPKQVVIASKIAVFGWAIFSSVLASIFYGAARISMGWLFNFLGCATASGVFPIALSFTWKDLNKAGAVGGSIGGMILAFIVWLVTCKTYTGAITVDNLSNQWVSFAGNVTALVMGGLISISLSLIWPANFDFEKTRNRTSLVKDARDETQGGSRIEVNEIHGRSLDDYEEKKARSVNVGSSKDSDLQVDSDAQVNSPDTHSDLDMDLDVAIDHTYLDREFKKYAILVGVLAVILVIIIPVGLGASPYVFSPGFLLGYVIIIIIWLFFSMFYVVVWPLVESRDSIWRITKEVLHIKTAPKNE
ncbi:Urea active transporter [Candida viswanathii]|uniref:Urea active transporter n=1 Tax=Candida viswanathii TaxID=5486 RepID=A0A367XZV1_9ASCO|nr:Urea active transporter [Candida viswanathii]